MRLFIYGTGRYASSFFVYAHDLFDDVAGFIESRKTKNIFMGKKVYQVDEIADYDMIIVASQFVYEIKSELYRHNIDFSKVIFLFKSWIPAHINEGKICYDFAGHKELIDDSGVFFDISGVYTSSESIADYIINDVAPEKIWNKIQKYDTNINAPHLSSQQRDMIERLFIPRLQNSDALCDLACASGEWSRFVSTYVQQIDAYDISQTLIDTAKKTSEEFGFNNINYFCADLAEVELTKVYDNALLLGVGIFFDIDSFRHLVDKLASHVKTGGYVAVRDTVTMYTDETIYLARKGTDQLFGDYRATYRPLKVYENVFYDSGFKLIEERYFSSYFHEPFELGSHGYIFRKV